MKKAENIITTIAEIIARGKRLPGLSTLLQANVRGSMPLKNQEIQLKKDFRAIGRFPWVQAEFSSILVLSFNTRLRLVLKLRTWIAMKTRHENQSYEEPRPVKLPRPHAL
eukprot:gene7415-8204_t